MLTKHQDEECVEWDHPEHVFLKHKKSIVFLVLLNRMFFEKLSFCVTYQKNQGAIKPKHLKREEQV